MVWDGDVWCRRQLHVLPGETRNRDMPDPIGVTSAEVTSGCEWEQPFLPARGGRGWDLSLRTGVRPWCVEDGALLVGSIPSER